MNNFEKFLTDYLIEASTPEAEFMKDASEKKRGSDKKSYKSSSPGLRGASHAAEHLSGRHFEKYDKNYDYQSPVRAAHKKAHDRRTDQAGRYRSKMLKAQDREIKATGVTYSKPNKEGKWGGQPIAPEHNVAKGGSGSTRGGQDAIGKALTAVEKEHDTKKLTSRGYAPDKRFNAGDIRTKYLTPRGGSPGPDEPSRKTKYGREGLRVRPDKPYRLGSQPKKKFGGKDNPVHMAGMESAWEAVVRRIAPLLYEVAKAESEQETAPQSWNPGSTPKSRGMSRISQNAREVVQARKRLGFKDLSSKPKKETANQAASRLGEAGEWGRRSDKEDQVEVARFHHYGAGEGRGPLDQGETRRVMINKPRRKGLTGDRLKKLLKGKKPRPHGWKPGDPEPSDKDAWGPNEGKAERDPNAPLRGAMDEIPRHQGPPKGGFKPGGKSGEDERDVGRPVYRPKPGEDPTPPWRRDKPRGKGFPPKDTGLKGPKRPTKPRWGWKK